jgi:type VI secretion system ImpA family protein
MLQWMNEKLSIEIKFFPLTAPVDGSEAPAISLADIEAALHRQRVARRQGTPQDVLSGDSQFARSLQLTPPQFLHQTWNDLQHAVEVVDLLGVALDRYYGPTNSGLLRIRSALHDMALAISSSIPEDTLEPCEEAFTMSDIHSDPVSVYREPSAPALFNNLFADTQIDTREQAYETLTRIANFLARLEPHSPVPYLLHRAIAWGGMSLKELLPELLHDQAALKDVGHLLRFEEADAYLIDK